MRMESAALMGECEHERRRRPHVLITDKPKAKQCFLFVLCVFICFKVNVSFHLSFGLGVRGQGVHYNGRQLDVITNIGPLVCVRIMFILHCGDKMFPTM